MRIIAGKFRSRQLRSLKGLSLRPTSDRLRETLFNVLGDLVAGAHFVDLFAGTGAIGIEALSRGAREAIFVEKHPPAMALLKKNLESLEIHSGARTLTKDALSAVRHLADEKLRRVPASTYSFSIPLTPKQANTRRSSPSLANLICSPTAPWSSRNIAALLNFRMPLISCGGFACCARETRR